MANKQWTWKATGASASLTGGGVSGTFVKSDAQQCQELVGVIQDRRAMYQPVDEEQWDFVRSSVDAIRTYSRNAQYLPSSDEARKAIGRIRRACSDFANDFDRYGHDEKIMKVSLLALRKRIGVELLALVEKYDLDTDLDLAEYRESGLKTLLGWFKREPWQLADPNSDFAQ
ncbi:hypothetical protein [Rhodococcus opacus]|uniref:Uncharacterized protein n=1 Tax=Rhodococcus opacus TaxID=37919 RepID=A0A076EJ20_RHOOP|nr:hypothetical protein [Rhodococcus opacus]AII05163.1 hypothetical protein EP51_11280 [Rhodococcus opacus]